MSYEYEKVCAARAVLEESLVIDARLMKRKRALIADLVALEREHDERIQERRRAQRHLASPTLLKRLGLAG